MGWFRRRGSDNDDVPAEPPPGPDLAAMDPGLLTQLYRNAELLEQKAHLQHCNLDRLRALDTQAQAVQAWERVAFGDPNNPTAGQRLSGAYNRYAAYLATEDRPAEAVDQANEALRVLAPLSNDDPETILPLIHGTLGHLVGYLDSSGRHDDAALVRQDRARIESVLADDL